MKLRLLHQAQQLREILRGKEELVALLAVLAIYALLFAFGEFRYRMNDDVAISENASGGYYLRYVGAPLMHLIAILTSLVDANIDWYAILLVIANATSLFLIVSSIFRSSGLSVTSCLLSAIAMLLLLQFSLRISFTFTSILLGVSAIAYSYVAVMRDGGSAWKKVLLGGLVFAIAWMIRIKGGMGAMAMAGGLLVCVLLVYHRSRISDESWRSMGDLIRLGSVFCIFPVVMVLADGYLKEVHAHEKYAEFVEYDVQRGMIHGKPRMYWYLGDDKTLSEVGWESKHVHQFKNWMFFDESMFGIDKLKIYNKIADSNKIQSIRNDYFTLDGLGERTDKLFTPSLTSLVIILLIALSVVIKALHKRCYFLCLLSLLVVPAGFMYYLAFFQKIPSRVTVPLIAAVAVLVVVHSASYLSGKNSKGKEIASYVLLFCTATWLAFQVVPDIQKLATRDFDRRIAYVSDLVDINSRVKGQLLVTQPGKGLHEFLRDPFFHDNVDFIEVDVGWQTFSPRFYAQIANVGAATGAEFMKHIAICNDVKILSREGWATVLAQYIGEKHGLDVRVREIKKMNRSIGLYQVYAKDVQLKPCLVTEPSLT